MRRRRSRAIWSAASALASFAVEAEILRANPFFRLGMALGLSTTKKARQNRAKKKAMTREQVRLFLAKVQEMAPRFYVLFLLLVRSGLRINEALALRVKDVDLDAR